MDELVRWLREQLDVDEARTSKLRSYAQQTVLALQDPRHLGKFIPGWHEWPDVEAGCTERLAEVDAKRRILDEVVVDANGLDMSVDLDRRVGTRDESTEPYLGDQLVRLLALPYADRPGYREAWRP